MAEEFLLAKASYKASTGREQKKETDVLCYQIRMAFYPGEITPKEANRIGYELAMRWTKGHHAFLVTTHTDKKHMYDEHYDCVLCSEYQVLTYRTTNRDGYREYRSDPKICASCPTRHLCTHSKDCVKTVQRHIWKDYEELADDARYTPKYKELYKRRKETIERVFADAKEKHAMRYTQYRGLTQVANWVKLKFAAMNLKKLARWLWKDTVSSFAFLLILPIYTKKPVHA